MGNAEHPARDTPRTRAATLLAVGAVLVVVVLFAVAAIAALALNGASTRSAASAPGPTGGPARPTPASPSPSPSTPPGGGTSWDTTAQDAVAATPMVAFSVEAAQPHTLSPRTAGAAIALPPATVWTGAVPQGFPHTPEGALAQLKALDETGMQGLDPAAYELAWEELASPGAPASAAVGLVRAARAARSTGGLDATGPVDGLTSTYQVDTGLIKGTADDGNFVVPCVLGELSVITTNSARRVGLGDCQAMRWVGGGGGSAPPHCPVQRAARGRAPRKRSPPGTGGVSGDA